MKEKIALYHHVNTNQEKFDSQVSAGKLSANKTARFFELYILKNVKYQFDLHVGKHP